MSPSLTAYLLGGSAFLAVVVVVAVVAMKMMGRSGTPTDGEE